VLISVAVATVLFPSLSRLATRRDFDGFRSMVTGGMRQIAFLLIPASVICAVLAEPIVRLVYQRGDFTPSQTTVVAASLAAFSLGLAFNGAMLMLNRAFFSLQAAWVPTGVALANLGLNAVLDAAFYRLGIWGIPLSTSPTAGRTRPFPRTASPLSCGPSSSARTRSSSMCTPPVTEWWSFTTIPTSTPLTLPSCPSAGWRPRS
jgi:hypothetical protein